MRAAWLTPAESAERVDHGRTEAATTRPCDTRAAESGMYLRHRPGVGNGHRRWRRQRDARGRPLSEAAGAVRDSRRARNRSTRRFAFRNCSCRRSGRWATSARVRAADACLAGMQHEPLARACGEAYCWITGADLERDRLAAEEKPVDAPAFEDDDLDANLVPPPEALWPLPDAEAVKTHWLGAQADVARGRAPHPRPAGQRRYAAGGNGNRSDDAGGPIWRSSFA